MLGLQELFTQLLSGIFGLFISFRTGLLDWLQGLVI